MSFEVKPNGLWGPIVIMDLKSIPEGLDFDKLLYLFKTQGVVIYDSHNGGDAPQVINLSEQPKIEIRNANI